MKELYIKNGNTYESLDLNKDTNIVLNYTHTDITNPTTILGEYSYSVSVPRTPKNDRILGFVFALETGVNPDIVNNFGKYKYIEDSELVSAGKIYLEKWNYKGYTLSLSGGLSDALISLSKCSFGDSSTFEGLGEYEIFDYLKYQCGKPALNRFYIANDWGNSSGTGSTSLDYLTNPIYIAGFYPSYRGVYSDFDSKSIVIDGEIKENFADTSTAKTEVIEREKSEYRSYYQYPYIYVRRLFEMMKKKASDFGYNLELDSSFFNADNPDYNDVVYTLPSLYIGGEVESEVEYSSPVVNYTNTWTINNNAPFKTFTFSTNTTYVKDDKSQSTKVTIGFDQIKAEVTANTYTTTNHQLTAGDYLVIYPMNGLTITIEMADASTLETISEVGKYAYTFNPTNITYAPYLNLIESVEATYSELGYLIVRNDYEAPVITTEGEYTINFNNLAISEEVQTNNLDTSVILRVKLAVLVPSVNLFGLYYKHYYYSATNYNWEVSPLIGYISYNIRSGRKYDIINKDNKRSGQIITLQKLFGDNAPFDILIKYSKLYNLEWVVDDINDKITIRPFTYDKTDFINIDNLINADTIEESPVNDKRYFNFSFDALDADNLKEYKETYKTEYGGRKVDLGYNINDEEETLLDGVKSIATTTPQIYYYPSLLGGNIAYTTGEPMPLNMKDRKDAKGSGQFYYRSLRTFSPSVENLRGLLAGYVRITDDSATEVAKGTYCWHNKTGVVISSYSYLTEVNDNHNRLQFAEPNINYNNEEITTYNDLYSRFYEAYINDLYYKDNKKVKFECYLSYANYMKIKRGCKFLYFKGKLAYILSVVYTKEKSKIEAVIINTYGSEIAV